MYESEIWALWKTNENSLVIFQSKMLEKIYGSCKDTVITREWMIKKIRKLKELYQSLVLWMTSPVRQFVYWQDTHGVRAVAAENRTKNVSQGKRPIGRQK